ncbi:hypothetical protein [Natronorubrum halophilum]|uniref:hypothetical protein n=1 Tax=Natronorubrum halophilum TaxID=1702106 RepID=UPI000EF6AF8E|nr:hypothetical protein [Natronorubrum halophilum]
MSDRREPFAVRYNPPRGRPRKVVFEPRSAGGWDRITYEKRRGRWRITGEEIVADVTLETADGVAIGE